MEWSHVKRRLAGHTAAHLAEVISDPEEFGFENVILDELSEEDMLALITEVGSLLTDSDFVKRNW